MSDTNNTSTIDEKKNATNSTSNFENIKKFLKSVFFVFLQLIIYFTLSALVLYACKLGQSNILPTDEKCFPYTQSIPKFPNDNNGIPINMFNTFTDPPLSLKINFPYNEFNASNKIISLFREYKEKSDSNFLANYFISIIESMIHFNYSAYSYLLNILNGLPEIIIVLLGPFLFAFITLFIFIYDNIYLIYLWFWNMTWFFKKNMNNETNKNKNNWEGFGDIELTDLKRKKPLSEQNGGQGPIPNWQYPKITKLTDWMDYVFGFGLVFLFCILFWFILISLPVLPTITIFMCIFNGLGYEGMINNKSSSCLTIIKDLFKYYKVSMMSVFSFFVVISAFLNLGTIPGVFSIITIILIYFDVISIDLFKAASEEDFTSLSNYKQANKSCNNIRQKGGEDLIKNLKKISKILSNK
jgi:hypothetical protein